MNDFITRAEHRLYKEIKRFRLKNKTATLITDNCNGGIICHDMGMRFNSPTVNLWINPADFLKLLSNPQKYIGSEPTEIYEEGINYPIGLIDDIKLYFMHYDSFDAAKAKWLERSKRVDYDNLYIIMTDKNGCTFEHMKQFDSLPYPHKVLLVHNPQPDIKCSYYIKGFENCNELGILTDFRPGFPRRRYLDKFNYVRFLNEN